MSTIVEEIITLVDRCIELDSDGGVYCPNHDWSFEYEDDEIVVHYQGWPMGWIGICGCCEFVNSRQQNIETFRDALRGIVAMTEETRAVAAGQLKLFEA